MIIDACTCDDGFGVAHDHPVRWEMQPPGPTASGAVSNVPRLVAVPTGEVRIWVDWKAAYRLLARPNGFAPAPLP